MKKKEAENIFVLIESALYGKKLPHDFFPDWSYIEKCMNFSMLSPIFSALGEEINKKLNTCGEENLMAQIYQTLVISSIKQISAVALEKKIPFAILKGIILGTAYPDASTRVTGDIDFYVKPQNLYDFTGILEDMGAVLKEDFENGQVGVMEYRLGNGIVVEIHAYLAMSLTKRQSVVLDKYNMFDPESFVFIETDDMNLPTLNLTNQLVYMIYHTGKHFVFGSANIRMLVDISVYADHYRAFIDKVHLKNMLKELGFDKFANAIFAVCKDKLGMSSDIWDIKNPSHMNKLIKDLTGCDYFGFEDVVLTMEITNSTDKYSKHKSRSWKLKDIFRNFRKVARKLVNPVVTYRVISQYYKQWYWNLNNTDRVIRSKYE